MSFADTDRACCREGTCGNAMRSCYCGHAFDEHMEAPPWLHTPRVSPDDVLSCMHGECPCEGYDPGE